MRFEIDDLKFDGRGLVPVTVQDARTREVLTLAYMNAESLRRTIAAREMWFWSRSRSELWHKGETSGNTQSLVELRVDCDRDALVALVEPAGPACHTGAATCFHNRVGDAHQEAREDDASSVSPEGQQPGEAREDDASKGERKESLGALLSKLYALVETRRRERPNGSYTTYLFEQGLDKILKKVGEESAETIIAAKNQDRHALAGEVSDLIYHLVVLLVESGVTLDDIAGELSRRSEKRP